MPAIDAPVIRYLADACPEIEFRLIDIGCSGGIAAAWRSVGPRLRALAIDKNTSEIERLRRDETHAGIAYLAASAALPADHPFAVTHARRSHYTCNPWDRLSVVKTVALVQSAHETLPPAVGSATSGGEVANDAIVVPDYLRGHGVDSVDFIKIHADGADFDILHSFDRAFDDLGVLGVSIEVNYFGNGAESDRSFHNIDRFMKGRGFELFDATVRRYSLAALPSRYLWAAPAESEFGRPMFGDAVYVRDLSSPAHEAIAARFSSSKLLNLMCVFAAFQLPDCAAEVALRFRDRLGAVCDVNHILDLLAAQAQGPVAHPLTYAEYLGRFAANDASCYGAHTGPQAPAIAPPTDQEAHAPDRLALQRLRSLGWTPRVIFDVGASNGFWSETTASVYPDSQYHLFEPLAEHVPEYQSGLSAAMKQHPGFVLHQLALGSQSGELVAHRFPNAYASTTLPLDNPEEGVRPIRVPVTTINELVQSRGLPIPGLLKLDVQGSEFAILQGAEHALASVDVLLVETWLWRTYEGKTPLLIEIASWLAGRGFFLWDVAGTYRSDGDVLASIDCFFVNASSMKPYLDYRQYRAVLGAVDTDTGERARLIAEVAQLRADLQRATEGVQRSHS